MNDKSNPLSKQLHASRKTILLVVVVASVSILLSALVSILLSRNTDLRIPSLGNITTFGVEAYNDKDQTNKTERVNWGSIWPGGKQSVTLYLRSLSNVETTLHLAATNWNPSNIADFLNLTWSYNGTTVQPGEVVEVTLTLQASSSNLLIQDLIMSGVKQFNFDIIIKASEHVD